MSCSVVKVNPTAGTAEITYPDGTTKKFDFLPPFTGAVKNFRNSGYSLMETVLELVDNSASAQSSNIKIVMVSDDRNKLVGWAVVDDGAGMTLEGLMDGFVIGTPKINRTSTDIGKFHTGLKSATIATGSYTVILTMKEGSGVVSGLVANYDQMSQANTHVPTHIEPNVTELWACTHNIPKYLFENIKANGKGTVVYTTQILPKFQRPINYEMNDLTLKLPLKYSVDGAQTLFVQHNNEEPLRIQKKSLFYENTPDSLQDSRKYQIDVYREENEDSETSYNLRVTVTAPLQGVAKTKNATPEKPMTLEFQRTKIGKARVVPVTKNSYIPKSEAVGVIVRPILLRESIHEMEKTMYTETVPSRAYYHFWRGPRSVGQSYTRFTSTKLHDRTHTLQDRFRCSATFPPALDEEFGVKHTKQMEDKEMPCADIADLILLLGRAAFTEFTKDHYEGETAGQSVVTGEDTAETENHEDAAADDNTSGASSVSEEVSVETVQVQETAKDKEETVVQETKVVVTPSPKQVANDLLTRLMTAIARDGVPSEKVQTMIPIIEKLVKSAE